VVAAAMFKSPPSDKELSEMAAAGLAPEDFEGGGPVEVWPENHEVYFLFSFMQTQWYAGAMGLTGLRYAILWKKMDRMGLNPDECDEMENDIRVMEFAAMAAMNGRDAD
jgi:hypothetical protein